MMSPPQGYVASSVLSRYLWHNVRDYGARGDNVTDDTVAILATINAAKAVGGVAFFPAGRYICSNLTLPVDLNGYGIEGAFAPLQNDMATGSIIVAKTGMAGNLWKLSTASHSNGIWLRRLGFDTNSVALDSALDLSQSELASFFLLEDFWILGNTNMIASSNMLNLDGNEATVLRRVGLSPNGTAGATLKAHVTGGELTFIDCVALSGTMNVGGLLVKWVNCVQGGPIFCDSGSVNNFSFVNHWIESTSLGGAAITNSSGQQLRIQVLGGRWNQQSSRAFIAAGATSTIASIDGVIFNSNDASATPIMSGGGARLFLGPNYQLIGGATLGVTAAIQPTTWGATIQKSESAADTNVLTFTPPATAGTYRLHLAINVSAATAATLGWTATWKDSNGSAQAPTNLDLIKNGVAAPGLTFLAAAGDTYVGDTMIDIDNSGTAIVCKLTFTGTSFTAKVSAFIEQMG